MQCDANAQTSNPHAESRVGLPRYFEPLLLLPPYCRWLAHDFTIVHHQDRRQLSQFTRSLTLRQRRLGTGSRGNPHDPEGSLRRLRVHRKCNMNMHNQNCMLEMIQRLYGRWKPKISPVLQEQEILLEILLRCIDFPCDVQTTAESDKQSIRFCISLPKGSKTWDSDYLHWRISSGRLPC